jgi:hypothetical protein
VPSTWAIFFTNLVVHGADPKRHTMDAKTERGQEEATHACRAKAPETQQPHAGHVWQYLQVGNYSVSTLLSVIQVERRTVEGIL